MRVAVIGAGAVGGTIAALLDRAGHAVEVTARGRHLETIGADGIRLNGAWGEHTARVEAGETLSQSPDIAFVSTKARDAEAALLTNAPFLPGIPVVVIQNGLEGPGAAGRAAPRSDVVGGLALYAASFLSPGEITVTSPGATYLGGELLPTLYALRLLAPVMPTVSTDNFVGAQWTKLVVNHINALPAITGLSAQEVISHRGLRLVMTESMREAVRVGIARGITFETMQGLGNTRLRLLAALPAGLGQLVPRLMSRRMGRRPNPGSTLQSIRRGQPTEIDYLNGAVVAAGRELGVPTPVDEALVALVHEVEDSGDFLSPEQVLQRIG
ncbi:MAG TPA: 2-dehydropantoate 2-reductase [Lacisediminihabitans sp.]|uniref:ketopantoate reductase family protein n=1 Tax=Lacisediminihabitans sp. TaxID=2787631 RepID=UPI002EDA000B